MKIGSILFMCPSQFEHNGVFYLLLPTNRTIRKMWEADRPSALILVLLLLLTIIMIMIMITTLMIILMINTHT